MADDSTKGVDNVIKGPWSKAKIITKSQTDKIANDMMFADDVAESVMIPLIHGLGENGVDIKTDAFVAEIGFINEVIRSIIFRTMKYPHPLHTLISSIMSTKTESVEDVYSKFDADILEKLIKTLEDKKEKDK
jgi:hypothetical protein